MNVTEEIALVLDCGANAAGGGGFQPGNTCAAGGGGAVEEADIDMVALRSAQEYLRQQDEPILGLTDEEVIDLARTVAEENRLDTEAGLPEAEDDPLAGLPRDAEGRVRMGRAQAQSQRSLIDEREMYEGELQELLDTARDETPLEEGMPPFTDDELINEMSWEQEERYMTIQDEIMTIDQQLESSPAIRDATKEGWEGILASPRGESLTNTLNRIGVEGKHDAEAVIKMIGADEEDLDNANRLLITQRSGSLTLTMDSPKMEMMGIIRKEDGVPILYGSLMKMKGDARGSGEGIRIFKNQVEAARNIGLKKIKLDAAGNAGSTKWNGYNIWPRVGFDAPINQDAMSSAIVSKVKKKFPDVKKLSDLMRTKAGREHWKKVGGFTTMEFDLADDSHSMKMFNRIAKRMK